MNPPDVASSKAPTNSTSIESVELSITKLIKNCHRKLEWQNILNPNTAPWRSRLVDFLESIIVRVLTIILLIVDLIVSILQLSSSLLSCTPKKKYHLEHVWYHWVEIGILILLSVKIVGLAIGLGSSFFRRPGYVIDGVVVIGAIILEIFLKEKGGGLIVVVSLWRVLRLVESAFELSDEAIEAQIEGILCQFEALKDENIKLKEAIGEKDKMIEELREELDQFRCICLRSLQ
ncbi:uncharacterized protein LOC116116314 [Pistacia vera]|uniref:uncharacterized protein LOC116116314 n=1 Tax=Pistacia vera TaxID=55513 RepID=UPI0012631ED6|nr:uncharacterized protein LOC116116314 [Pistacia vera]